MPGALPHHRLNKFADRAAATAYLEGPIIAQLRNNPAVTDISVRRFDVIPGPSATTRGIRAAESPTANAVS